MEEKVQESEMMKMLKLMEEMYDLFHATLKEGAFVDKLLALKKMDYFISVCKTVLDHYSNESRIPLNILEKNLDENVSKEMKDFKKHYHELEKKVGRTQSLLDKHLPIYKQNTGRSKKWKD